LDTFAFGELKGRRSLLINGVTIADSFDRRAHPKRTAEK
jgi:hypothetical protein